MGLFSSKRKVDMAEFCRNYYDFYLFHALVDGEDASQKILDFALQSLADADPVFSRVERAVFERETAALRLEVFALAWLHRFWKDVKVVPQSVFTHHYLEEIGRLEVWEAMGNYNRALAQARPRPANTRAGRALVIGLNKFGLDTAEKWVKLYAVDLSHPTEEQKTLLECIGRVINRFGADLMSNNEIGNRHLAALLLQGLGWEEQQDPPNTEALGILAAQPFAEYEFAKQLLSAVDLLP